jgi:hypothetical protein
MLKLNIGHWHSSHDRRGFLDCRGALFDSRDPGHVERTGEFAGLARGRKGKEVCQGPG